MGQKSIMATFDLATKKTGIAVWHNGQYKESYVINYEKIEDIEERTELMGKKLISALNYFQPTLVYSEDSFRGQNPKTVKCLCRIHGIVMGWCLEHNVEYHFIMPSAWRKYIPGFPNGRYAKRPEQKAFAVQYVKEHYGFSSITDDQADAICIGEAVIRMNKGGIS